MIDTLDWLTLSQIISYIANTEKVLIYLLCYKFARRFGGAYSQCVKRHKPEFFLQP